MCVCVCVCIHIYICTYVYCGACPYAFHAHPVPPTNHPNPTPAPSQTSEPIFCFCFPTVSAHAWLKILHDDTRGCSPCIMQAAAASAGMSDSDDMEPRRGTFGPFKLPYQDAFLDRDDREFIQQEFGCAARVGRRKGSITVCMHVAFMHHVRTCLPRFSFARGCSPREIWH